MNSDKLHFKVLVAMILGCLLGLLFKNVETTMFFNVMYKPTVMLGTIFIRLLKMIMIPLILTSIIIGVSSIGSGRKIGRIGLKTLSYYLFTSLCAILIGLTLLLNIVSNFIKMFK